MAYNKSDRPDSPMRRRGGRRRKKVCVFCASDAKAILEAAGMDMKKVRYAYGISRKSGRIDNIVGWMISAIKNGYTENASGVQDADFEQNTYDFEELERRFVEN